MVWRIRWTTIGAATVRGRPQARGSTIHCSDSPKATKMRYVSQYLNWEHGRREPTVLGSQPLLSARDGYSNGGTRNPDVTRLPSIAHVDNRFFLLVNGRRSEKRRRHNRCRGTPTRKGAKMRSVLVYSLSALVRSLSAVKKLKQDIRICSLTLERPSAKLKRRPRSNSFYAASHGLVERQRRYLKSEYEQVF